MDNNEKENTLVEETRIKARYGLSATVVKALAAVTVVYILKDTIQDATKFIMWLIILLLLLLIINKKTFDYSRRKTKYWSQKTEKLEKIIDLKRTSSGLTKTGETHPRDK